MSMRQLGVAVCCAILAVPVHADDEKVDKAKTVSGTLTMGDQTYKLEHAVAFETKRSDKVHTGLILSESPVDMAKLKDSLKKKGTDSEYFFFKPQVKLIFDEKGKLDFVFIYADGASINSGGNKNMTAEVKIKDGTISGKSSMTKPEKFFKMEYTFDAKFDVKIMKPE